MRNTFGNVLTVTLFGESHGPETGCVLDGLPAGFAVDEELLKADMAKRQGLPELSTARRETDEVRIVSGLYNGRTTGTPLTILIANRDVRRSDYEELADKPRPSHADYTQFVRYQGYADRSGGGHFSARLTAPLTAAGSLLKQMLAAQGIRVGTHVLSLGDLCDHRFDALAPVISELAGKNPPVLDDAVLDEMKAAVAAAKAAGDSLGGVLETAVCGLPAGVGEPFFDTVEGHLAKAMFAIPGVKGIEFGAGFGFAGMKGSAANDPFVNKDGVIRTDTNHSGGINGGLTNGMPVLFRTVYRPTPSIARPQKTITLSDGKETILTIQGRHDPAIVLRAPAVQDAVTCLVIGDLLASLYGVNWLEKINR